MEMTLREALRSYLAVGNLDCWFYLQEDVDPLTLESPCLMLDGDPDEDLDDAGIPLRAITCGFPVVGLEGGTISEVVHWARQFADPPSDELLLESFVYYWCFDAFLPFPGAPDPPPEEEAGTARDREFYLSLGGERPDVPCREPGCTRGAISGSACCRVHHFEMIQGRHCPFND